MSGENEQAPGIDQELIARMSRPLDTSVEFHTIPTKRILELYQVIDEIPMKFARMLLPMIQGSIEPLKGKPRR
jgi:hypothetical protein